MAVYYPPPEPEICLKCGGSIPYIDVNQPSPVHNNCRCLSCIVIGPGHRPMWRPDTEHHICQTLIDRNAIAKAKRRFKNSPLARATRTLRREIKAAEARGKK